MNQFFKKFIEPRDKDKEVTPRRKIKMNGGLMPSCPMSVYWELMTENQRKNCWIETINEAGELWDELEKLRKDTK